MGPAQTRWAASHTQASVPQMTLEQVSSADTDQAFPGDTQQGSIFVFQSPSNIHILERWILRVQYGCLSLRLQHFIHLGEHQQKSETF